MCCEGSRMAKCYAGVFPRSTEFPLVEVGCERRGAGDLLFGARDVYETGGPPGQPTVRAPGPKRARVHVAGPPTTSASGTRGSTAGATGCHGSQLAASPWTRQKCRYMPM